MPCSLALCALIFVGGCFFEADYSGGNFACNDGKCPSGLVCIDKACVTPPDAAVDDAHNDAPDAREAALTCADPGVLTSGRGAAGNTQGRPATVASQCAGFIMNGRDAVYRITVPAGDQLRVEITGNLRAYVIAQCISPAPACVGNVAAVNMVPINVSPPAGDAFVIVDHEFASTVGAYTVTATTN